MLSTKTAAFSASVFDKVTLENVLGMIRSNSIEVRFKMIMQVDILELDRHKDEFLRKIFLVSKPSRLSLSLTTWVQIL